MSTPKAFLIAGVTPYFLKKRRFWFEKHFDKIKDLSKTKPWWQRHCLFLREKRFLSLTNLLQKLMDLGYEKVQTASFPGEFSQQGGIMDLFPINKAFGLRLEFFGNQIELISKLELVIPPEEKVRQVLEKKLKSQKLFSGLKDLKPGDCLVHLDHGVGRFLGISSLKESDTKYYLLNTIYYVLEYAKNDKLYVPMGLERKLSRYIGFVEPKINRLDSNVWQKTKGKIKEEVEKFAKDLLQIYAHRETATRPPYFSDKDIESLVETSFPYQETPDQISAWQDITEDLQKSKPMDRLICGDVGFGKTEIAFRAMVKAVLAGCQTALLCPTTILANQHFQNLKMRLKGLPVNIALLCRFQTEKEQQEISNKIRQGKIDIIIATHRLLSKDIQFAAAPYKGLGLLVIDDEQRFGVRQKEKLKQMRASLDVLSLSATPIPRTLYLTLSSLREMSLIQTPLPGRIAIKTFILPWSIQVIKKAIEQELSRHGQVYYLHNRVATITKVMGFLESLLPKIKIGLAHGKMKEKDLIQAMTDFQQGKTDVLLATTIIENGLDLPNVNTLIVDDASRLGLSQAYQIRGRVGRFNKQAFAYFLHPQRLLPLAKERLNALKNAEALGSGWQVAIKDLEIRGAGNILGKQQSGHINQVGLNLYCQMLNEAVSKNKD